MNSYTLELNVGYTSFEMDKEGHIKVNGIPISMCSHVEVCGKCIKLTTDDEDSVINLLSCIKLRKFSQM